MNQFYLLLPLLLLLQWVANAQTFNGTLRIDPKNPRFFTDNSGKAILLTGSHTWANFQDIGLPNDKPFDWKGYLEMLKTNNHNFIRLWVWEQAKKAAWTEQLVSFYPLPYQTVQQEGKTKFDLTKWNDEYFIRLRQRVVEAGKQGIFSVMLFQGWALNKSSIRSADPWEFHPFNPQNNINGVGKAITNNNQDDSDLPTLHSMKNGDVLKHQEAYTKKIVETLNDLDNVLYEIINEGGTKEWQYHLIHFIKAIEKKLPKKHPVGMTHAVAIKPTMWNQDLLDSPADWISPADEPLDWKYPNSSFLIDYRSKLPMNDGKKVIILDSDHLWGCGGDYAWVWKAFLQGLNPIFMDSWQKLAYADTAKIQWLSPCLYDIDYLPYQLVRKNMGVALTMSQKIDLAKSLPQPQLASSGYCLAHHNYSYLVWAERNKYLTLNLRNTSGEYEAEWYQPTSGIFKKKPETIKGGDYVVLASPFPAEEAVLYLKKK